MAKFGNWQKFLDSCVKRLVDDRDHFESFMKAKTDEERILLVRQSEILKIPWIEKYFEAAQSGVNLKSTGLALHKRKEGNRCFEKKQFQAALQCYNECIISAPLEDEDHELALGFANRSAVFYHLGNYNLCLGDVQLAEDHGYPAVLSYKLTKRRSQCLLQLQLWEEAREAVLLAKEKFTQHASADVKKQNAFAKEVEELLKKVDEKSLTKNSGDRIDDATKRKIPAPFDGFSSTLKQASRAVDFRHSLEKGRHLVANRDLTAGEVLIVEQPYAAVLLPSHYTTHCNHCFRKVLAIIPCHSCTSVVYCSRKCQTESWNSCHSTECRLLDLLQSVGIAHLSLRVVLTAQLQPLIDFRDKVLRKYSNTDEAALGLTSEGLYECNYLSVYHLMPHTNDMPTEDLYQYAITGSLLLSCLERSGYFDSPCAVNLGANEFESLNINTRSSDILFIGGLLLRHICQLVCNAHAITDLELTQFSDSSLVDTQSQVRIATAIYPTASLMNHSCDPTIISSFCDRTLIIRNVKDVKAGDEIFNCYGPHCKRMSRFERQQHLKEQYFFKCHCEPCSSGDQGQELHAKALKCDRCEGPLIAIGQENYSCMKCGHGLSSGEISWDDLRKADGWFARGLDLLEQHKTDDAIMNFEACLKIRNSRLHSRNRDLSEVQDALAQCCSIKGDFLSAYKYLSKSIQTTEHLYGSTSIELAHELQKYCEVCFHAGRNDDATAAARRSSELFALNYGPDCDPIVELKQLVNLNLGSKCIV